MGGIVLAMTLTRPISVPVRLSAGQELLINTAGLGIAGDDSASCSLAFTRYLGKKFAILARRYNAVTLNDSCLPATRVVFWCGWRV